MSTAEVASELSKCPVIAEANVYGVQVPGEEGRAGCAGKASIFMFTTIFMHSNLRLLYSHRSKRGCRRGTGFGTPLPAR